MKMRYILGFGLVLGALSLAGCANETGTNTDVNGEGRKISLTVKANQKHAVMPGTKTEMTGTMENKDFATVWLEGDKIGIYTDFEGASGTSTRSFNDDLVIEAGAIQAGKATFTGDVYSGVSTRVADLYAYYPHASGNNVYNSTYDDVAVSIYENQTMSASGSYDSSNALMVALPTTIDVTDVNNVVVENLQFAHLTTFINLYLREISTTNPPATVPQETEEVISVSIATTGPAFAGSYKLNLNTGDIAQSGVGLNKITVAAPAGMTLGNLSSWIVAYPFELSASDMMEVTVTTQEHTIVKSITGSAFSFPIGRVVTLGLSIDSDCTVTGGVVLPLYEEDFGEVGNSTAVTAYTGYQKGGTGGSSVTYGASATSVNIRKTGTINTHVWLPAANVKTFDINTITVGDVKDFTFSYKVRSNSTSNPMSYSIKISNDGTNWQDLTDKTISVSSDYASESISFSVISDASVLHIRFGAPVNAQGIRLDDLLLEKSDTSIIPAIDLN